MPRRMYRRDGSDSGELGWLWWLFEAATFMHSIPARQGTGGVDVGGVDAPRCAGGCGEVRWRRRWTTRRWWADEHSGKSSTGGIGMGLRRG